MNDADKLTELLQGSVEKILFQNTQTGFTILMLHKTSFPVAKDPIIVKGYLPTIRPGEHVQFNGIWVMHSKFGKQFEAQKWSTQAPNSIAGLKKYLASGLIKGIGDTYAEKLVNYFGQNILAIIDESPARLREVPGIGEKRVETIIKAWQEQKEISPIMVFLQEKNITPALSAKIYKKYGAESIAVILENPYRLAEEIWGIGFKTADQIALSLNYALDSIKRITAGILHCLSIVIQNGHLYITIEELKKNTITLLGLDENAMSGIKNALHDLYNKQKISLITHKDNHFVALTRYYLSEKGVAYKIKKLLTMPSEYLFDIDTITTNLRADTQDNLILNKEQQEGIIASLQHKITIITGGPGTGKTTLIKTLLTILDDHDHTYKLAAPTGRAAKRIQEGTQRYAETLHRLLEFDVSTMNFTKNEQNALKTNFLIIDEASMIDIFLAHALLKALPYHAHLILIGDINQLPSVGAGNFLSDLIASAQVPCIRLSTIFRQAQESLIIINAHKINNGEFPVHALPDTKRDFIYIKEENPDNVAIHLEHIIKKGLPSFAISPKDMVVLVPMNRGTVGTQKINFDIQKILNPFEKEQLIQAGTTFKVDDRVMQIRNNYDKNIFNGDIGTIESINKKDLILLVSYPDKIVSYDFNELDELVLAYAISIHKSQGSEYPAVIIPLFMQHFMLLQRNLLYTAVTRAKKICILIGQPKAIALCIGNDKGLTRTTFLKEYLTSDLESR